MLKYFPLLFFCISIKCLANLPINCTNINGNTPNMVANILNYMCKYNKLDKINYIPENNSTINKWIANGYFFLIDQAENVVLMPYEIFKKLLSLAYFGSIEDNLISDSSVVSVSEQSTIPKIANISSLVKVPLDSLFKFINTNNYYSNYYRAFSVTNFFIFIAIGAAVVIISCLCCKCIRQRRPKTRIYSIPKRIQPPSHDSYAEKHSVPMSKI